MITVSVRTPSAMPPGELGGGRGVNKAPANVAAGGAGAFRDISNRRAASRLQKLKVSCVLQRGSSGLADRRAFVCRHETDARWEDGAV